MSWTFAVIADSHFHPPGEPEQAAWASDARFNARNAAVVEMLRRVDPEVVVHLGDVPHPVPGLEAHAAALAVAQQTYAPLDCPLWMVPGNHDVGDKPHPWAPAPGSDEDKHRVFREHWGPPWWCREHRGVRFVGIDTPVLNSGQRLEAEQWAWLEMVFSTPHPGPTFAFLHYPPFLLHPDEDEHYDNLAEPARSRLLELLHWADVRTVFCGHVHHPFWNRHRGMELFLLPATSFVRPGYAELARVGPGPEFGRDEVGRLGFCLVQVEEDGEHRVEWVRTEGVESVPAWSPGLGPGERTPELPLGLTLRHAWDAVHEIPADGLDPFRRKEARNDLALLAALELGVLRLRLPLSDLARPQTRERLAALGRQGLRCTFFTPRDPTDSEQALLHAYDHLVAALELVRPRERLADPLPELDLHLHLAPLGRGELQDERYFSHFSAAGFLPGESCLLAQGIPLLRVPDDVAPWEGVKAASRVGGAALIELPRAGESACFTDDVALAHRVAEAFLAARRWPRVSVSLDAFVDHDRGYFPRHGLIDRRGNPRAGFRVLRSLARLVPAGVGIQRIEDPRGRAFEVDGVGVVLLPEREVEVEGVDLGSGCPVEGSTALPVLIPKE